MAALTAAFSSLYDSTLAATADFFGMALPFVALVAGISLVGTALYFFKGFIRD